MTPDLDRADIQGNVLQPYGRNSFPMGHLLLFHVEDGFRSGSGLRDPNGPDPRRFLDALLPQITTARLHRSKRTRRWFPSGDDRLPPPPPVTVNVAFTCRGLQALGVPQSTLNGFPPEFQQGMRERAAVLNDEPSQWDPVWQEAGEQGAIDVLIQLRVNISTLLRKVYERKMAEDPKPEHRPRAKADYHNPGILHLARQAALRRLQQRSQSLILLAEQQGLRLLRGHTSGGDGGGTQAEGQACWQFMETLLRARSEDGVLAEDGKSAEEKAEEGQSPGDQRYGEYEHFGFFDGIADPVFAGQYPGEDANEELLGQGRRSRGSWKPLATGEFLMGYPDEAQEMPAQAVPFSFSRNGTFMVVRKLHQHLARFERTLTEQLPAFQAWLQEQDARPAPATDDPHDPGQEAAAALLRAKLMGRWADGTPLVLAPTYREWQEFRQHHQQRIAAAALEKQSGAGRTAQEELKRFRRQFRDFTYEPRDHEGGRCPFTAHIRRSNPRDSGDPNLLDDADLTARQQASSVLVNRRRLLRRSMTYGAPARSQSDGTHPEAAGVDDARERGTLFMALCTGVFRQFEFVQQQWLNYGSEFGAGNDACPISGAMAPGTTHRSKLMIAAPDDSSRPPFVFRSTTAVECRGGGYFFVPSLTALRQIARGLVDPI